jgi:hypothetical protein
MRRSTTGLSCIALLLAFVIAGCGGGSEEGGGTDGDQTSQGGSGELGAKVIDVKTLPKLEDSLPPLDEGRIEVAAPEGWRPMSRNMDFVARFAPKGVSGSTPPRILVTAAAAPGDSPKTLTASDAAAFEAYMGPILDKELSGKKDIRETPRTLIIGDRPWSRYVLARKTKQGVPVDGQVLKTVANGRIYTMELQVYHQTNMIEFRDEAYAIAAGMKFPKVAAADGGGEESLGNLLTGDGEEDEEKEDDGEEEEGGEKKEGGDETKD